VWFDDYLFTPVYLGVLVAVASSRLRDGLWLAALSFVGLFTVKFPSSGLIGLIAADGGRPDWPQYAIVVAALLLIVAAAHALGRVHPLAAPAALVLWVLVVPRYVPGGLADLSVYTQVFLAMAVAVIAPRLDQIVVEGGRPISRRSLGMEPA
jgi:hypothetical protein